MVSSLLMGQLATLGPSEGRFGGAVAVEEGTENLIQNGNAEGGYIWWSLTITDWL